MRKMLKTLKIVVALLVVLPCLGCAELLKAIETTPSLQGALDEDTVAAGLREALRIGSERSIVRTSAVDGFLSNELIRIAIPRRVQSVTEAMRQIGLDGPVDELELGMNRAAEKASAEARELFWNAIRDMTIQDAFAILRGEDDAATAYLRERTGAELRARIEPIVATKMDEVGLSRAWRKLGDRIELIPGVSRPTLDLEAHVVDETLDGLFTVLAEEEQRIREDPLARTTDLLRRVFVER